jgi:hypothetical protein
LAGFAFPLTGDNASNNRTALEVIERELRRRKIPFSKEQNFIR